MWEPPVGGFCPLQRQVRNGGVGGSGGAADPEIPVRSGRGSYTVIYTHRYVVSGRILIRTQRGHCVRGWMNRAWWYGCRHKGSLVHRWGDLARGLAFRYKRVTDTVGQELATATNHVIRTPACRSANCKRDSELRQLRRFFLSPILLPATVLVGHVCLLASCWGRVQSLIKPHLPH
jgi:hypothetical protein